MARLRRADCSAPGILRIRRGRGFYYVDQNGNRISDPQTLSRIKVMTIPPAWTDVWICAHPMGHIQAVGIDAAGRKQYLYHEKWRTARDRLKFQRMIQFAQSLPTLRQVITDSIRQPDLSFDRVMACTVRMLDRGLFRIGSEEYASKNETFGIATMLKRHVKVGPEGLVTFDYVSKGGKRQIQSIVDPEVADIVRQLKKRRHGKELMAYKSGGRWVDVRSTDINDYIKSVTGQNFTAKDFRTWSATVLAAVALAKSEAGAASTTARKRAVSAAVREVADQLGNTPAVCRSSYIHPRVIDEYFSGVTIAPAITGIDLEKMDDLAFREAIEEAVLALIEGETIRPSKVA